METFTQANGLGSDLVGAMARDSSGELWVATFAGLSRLHGGKIDNYTTANGLSSNVVTALLPYGNGTLLIGTQDHGWNLWDGQHFTAETNGGLNQTTIHAILDDGSGHLWFATGNGIARCDCAVPATGCRERLLALDRVRRCRRVAQPGDGHQQPSFGLALPRWASLVCHAQGPGGGGPGALPGKRRSAAGRAGAICRGRCTPGTAFGKLFLAS